MPKKCCRQLDEINNEVYIWTKVYESNMQKTKEFVENLKETKQESILH